MGSCARDLRKSGLDIVVSLPAIEPNDVDSEQATQLSIECYQRRFVEHTDYIGRIIRH